MPCGAYILWPEMLSRSQPRALTSSGSLPAAWIASVWNSAPAAWALLGQFADGLEDAGLVVGEHYADQFRIGAQCGFERGHFDDSLRCAGQEGDFDATVAEFFGGMEHGVMLDGGGDEVIARREHTEQRHVVALRAAGGEDDLGGAAVQQAGDGFARAVHGGARVLAALMDGAGVAKLLRPERLASPPVPRAAQAWWRSRPCRCGACSRILAVGRPLRSAYTGRGRYRFLAFSRWSTRTEACDHREHHAD